MQNKKFEINDRVGARRTHSPDLFTKKLKYCYGLDEDVCFGTVKEIVSKTVVKVLWDDNFYNQPAPRLNFNDKVTDYYPVDVFTKNLLSAEDAKLAYSVLEKEFKSIESVIKIKMKEAATLIREANKLSKKINTDLSELDSAISPLYSAMDACGWNTSSFNC